MNNIKNKWVMKYLLFYGILLLIICSVNVPKPIGEWDDYSLPIASIINEFNFTISEDDIVVYKQIFPDWENNIENYELSGYMDKAENGELTWYFPTYAIICIPFVFLLQVFRLPTIYAFSYANLALLMIALIYTVRFLKVDEKRKVLLTILLSVNPIIFYISWPSAEVFLYSMLVMGAVCWYNGWKKGAAVFVSLAGMLNPTIMSIGIVMIVEYLCGLVKCKRKDEKWKEVIKNNIADVLQYGSCYIIGIIPMVYNYYNMGHINLTASKSFFVQGNESTLTRFIAYLFDLNFGFLPYYFVLLLVSGVLLFMAILHKHVRYIEWMATFLINVFLYSIMVHINCGMSGISRYNAWSAVLLIFSVVLYGEEIVHGIVGKRVMRVLLYIGALFTGMIIRNYNPYLASNTSCQDMTPIAEWVLDNYPGIYNPMHSTFNCRTNHKDGAYEFADDVPIVYSADDGFIRKVLASQDNKEELLSNFVSCNNSEDWYIGKINELGEELEYISIPRKYEIMQVFSYTSGMPLVFSEDGFNAADYVVCGLNVSEDWGTWTEGEEFCMRFVSTIDCEVMSGMIECNVFNEKQDVRVYVNDTRVLKQNDFQGGILSFEFENPGKGKLVSIRIELPEAISPKELGQSDDERTLALGIKQILFSKK